MRTHALATVKEIVRTGLAEELSLRYYPDPILRRKALAVETVDRSIRDLATKMLEMMYREDGVGLAAPQVGLSIRMLVLNTTGEPAGEKVVLNPRIVETAGDVDSDEGCLSFPGMRLKLKRDERITLEYTGLDGRTQRLPAEGLLSRAIQHEIDHLDGVLFIDKITPAAKAAVKGQLKDLERRYAAR